RLVFPLSVIGYALLKDDEASTAWPRALSYLAILLSAAGLLVAADLAAWLATSTRELTPSGLLFSVIDRAQADWNALLLLSALFALALATVRARSVAHGGDVRLADRALPDHFGRSPLRRRMVCRTPLLSRFLDARVGRPAFRNRFALCAAGPFRDGGKSRTRSAVDDHGCVVGLDRARDESTASQYRHERRCGCALDGAPDAG